MLGASVATAASSSLLPLCASCTSTTRRATPSFSGLPLAAALAAMSAARSFTSWFGGKMMDSSGPAMAVVMMAIITSMVNITSSMMPACLAVSAEARVSGRGWMRATSHSRTYVEHHNLRQAARVHHHADCDAVAPPDASQLGGDGAAQELAARGNEEDPEQVVARVAQLAEVDGQPRHHEEEGQQHEGGERLDLGKDGVEEGGAVAAGKDEAEGEGAKHGVEADVVHQPG